MIVLLATVLVPSTLSRVVLSYLIPRRTVHVGGNLGQIAMHCAIPLLLLSIFFAPGSLVDPSAAAKEIFASGWSVTWWLICTLIAPIIQAGVVAKVLTSARLRNRLKRFGFRPLMPQPTAWDYMMQIELSCPAYVLVWLRDGSSIYGYFGQRSFAASCENGSDIFLQQVLSGDGQPSPPDRGCWISGEEIQVIEMLWGVLPNNEKPKKSSLLKCIGVVIECLYGDDEMPPDDEKLLQEEE